jgi:hypothetical protein
MKKEETQHRIGYWSPHHTSVYYCNTEGEWSTPKNRIIYERRARSNDTVSLTQEHGRSVSLNLEDCCSSNSPQHQLSSTSARLLHSRTLVCSWPCQRKRLLLSSCRTCSSPNTIQSEQEQRQRQLASSVPRGVGRSGRSRQRSSSSSLAALGGSFMNERESDSTLSSCTSSMATHVARVTRCDSSSARVT